MFQVEFWGNMHLCLLGCLKMAAVLVFSFPLLCSTTTHTTTLLIPRKCGIHKREKNGENTCKSGESFLLVFPRNGVAFELPAVTTRALCSYCVCQVKPLAEHRATGPREGPIGGVRLQKQRYWGLLPQRFYKNSPPLLCSFFTANKALGFSSESLRSKLL